MSTVWILPIEPFEERYTAQWLHWWPAELRSAGLQVDIVLGNMAEVTERSSGEFLDPCITWAWKGSQVATLARYWRSGLIKDGDVILTLDIWGPATTAALYLRDTTGRKVKVAGFYHAGASDPEDFLSRVGTQHWALPIEEGWFKGVDAILVGSEFSQRMASGSLDLHGIESKVHPVGLPIHKSQLSTHFTPWSDRAPLVVFPHRLAPEKDPGTFATIEGEYRDIFPDQPVEFVRSRDVCDTKSAYYSLLGRARCVVSTARQETFGIAMQEGIALGAWAVAPDRLSYPETIRSGGWLYDGDDLESAAIKIQRALTSTGPAVWDGWHEDAIKRAAVVLGGLL